MNDSNDPIELRPYEFREIATDLYFFFDFNMSNAYFLVTDEGVFVVDTRQRPRHGQELLEDYIRKVADKPIRWVFNTQAHGDHHFGNCIFKREGATIVSHADCAKLMKTYFDQQVEKRLPSFADYGQDPNEAELTMPDVTFEHEMTIYLGGYTIKLLYFGPGQDPGNAFAYFPHAKAIATGGTFNMQSWPNPNFTPSMEDWIVVMQKLHDMDGVDMYLPGHGDIGKKQDVLDQLEFQKLFLATVKEAIAKGMSREEEAMKTIRFKEYEHWRRYSQVESRISSLYHLLTTGIPEKPLVLN